MSNKILGNKKLIQVSSLFLCSLIGLVIGFGTSIVNTRMLGANRFGDFKFLQNAFLFLSSLLSLGIFFSGGRLLAQKKHEKNRPQIVGSLMIYALTMSLGLILVMLIFSIFEGQLFKNNLGPIIRLTLPLLVVFPFQACYENILQGDNRIYELSLFRFAPGAIYLISSLSINQYVPLALTSLLLIYLVSLLLIIIIMSVHVKPSFKNIRETSSIIWRENKEYGIHVYIGYLTNVETLRIGGMLVAYFLDNKNVGYFFLATAIAAPLEMLPNVIGTTLYKQFANNISISNKTMLVTVLSSTIGLLIFILVAKTAIILFYSTEYLDVVKLAYLTAIGSAFRGIGDFYNKYLGAHGRGKELRNSAFANGIVNIVGYVILVKVFGVTGAAVTKMLSDIVYALMINHYYRVHRKELSKKLL